MNEIAPEGASGNGVDEDPHVSLGDDIAELIAEAKRAASAEIAFQSMRAKLAGGAVARIAALAALALALLFFVLMALIVGLLLGFSTLIGPWAATAIVVGALLLCTVLAGWGALAGLKRLRWLIAGGDGA